MIRPARTARAPSTATRLVGHSLRNQLAGPCDHDAPHDSSTNGWWGIGSSTSCCRSNHPPSRPSSARLTGDQEVRGRCLSPGAKVNLMAADMFRRSWEITAPDPNLLLLFRCIRRQRSPAELEVAVNQLGLKARCSQPSLRQPVEVAKRTGVLRIALRRGSIYHRG
jgi:hypothetical protein